MYVLINITKKRKLKKLYGILVALETIMEINVNWMVRFLV